MFFEEDAMEAKTIGAIAGVATMAVVGAVLIVLAQNRSEEDVVLSPEVITIPVEATVEELPTVVVTLEPTDLILPSEEVTLDTTEEILPPVVVTADATEEVFDIYADPRGACVAIVEGSSCVDYWGAYWTEETMQLHCNGVGTYVTDPCPTENRVAGCKTNAGTDLEFVLWVYDIGPNPVTGPNIGAYLAACAGSGGDPVP